MTFRLKLPDYQFRSMKGRLLSWMTLIALIPVLLLVVIGLSYAERQLAEEVKSEIGDLSTRLQYELDLLVTRQIEEARVFSRSPYLQKALADFSRIYRPDDLYSMSYQDLQDTYWTYLSFFAEKHELKDLLLVTTAGDVVFSAAQSDLYGRNLIHVDYSGTAIRQVFEQALWQMDSVASVGSGFDQKQYAFVAAPVQDTRLSGVLVMIPDTTGLAHFLDESSNESAQYLSVYRQENNAVWAEVLGPDRIERSSVVGKILSAAYLGRDFSGEMKGWGDRWLVSVRAIPALDGVVVVRRERDVALSAIIELRYSAWGVTLLILILSAIIARHVALTISAPVYELSRSIEQIAQGKRKVKADVNREDEIGTLARQFNQMAESLRTTQAQLLQTEKMASIGHLAAGVAHEINNPMSVVTANMNTMQDYSGVYVTLVDMYDRYIRASMTDPVAALNINKELQSFQEKEDISFVHQDMKALLEDSMLGLSRVKNIVSNLKVFSELDQSEDKEVSLRSELDLVMSEIAAPNKDKVEVQFQIELDRPVRFKPEQMRRVFKAVIDNALRACTDKGSLRIRAYRKGKGLYIEFHDTGCGMDDAQVNKVFDPFYTTRPVGEGIGLGLSIAHAIVEAHGGKMRLISRQGRGTKVQVHLPGR